MVKPITMYSCECDNCGETYETHDGIMATVDASDIQDRATNDFWYVGKDGKAYCEPCHNIDDETDELIINKSRSIHKQLNTAEGEE